MEFERAEWARLRASTPLTLSERDLAELQGLNERVSLSEVEAVYLPLSRLLNLHVSATQSLHRATDTFLGTNPNPLPYVIGVAGSVAVGKSTFARVLRALLAHWPNHPDVDLVTTDGFLHPNEVLEARGLMSRKGFPESYDVRKLVQFMKDLKDGKTARAPVYSHQSYNIIPNEWQDVGHSDIVIVEGLNMLQTGDGASFAPSGSPAGKSPRVFVSDFFDFSIYIDADEAHIEQWYIDRFQMLRETVFKDPRSYFHRYASLSDDEAVATARKIWLDINGLNLRENILPTRERARLVLEKGADHSVTRVRLRTL